MEQSKRLFFTELNDGLNCIEISENLLKMSHLKTLEINHAANISLASVPTIVILFEESGEYEF